MSDRYSRLFAEYTQSISWDHVPPETVHEVKRRILDSIGVAMAAFAEDTSTAARAYAHTFPDPRGATLWGTRARAHPEIACFANAVMVRYLDFNDTYLSKEPLHPSDMIAGLMALTEWLPRSPRDLITAIAVAYEVAVNLCDAASLREHGWDHVNYIAIGEACGVGTLLRLTSPQLEHALSITTVPHAAMRQTRAGELSMWKGAAAANAARNALFAALLSGKGMTGPFQPFEGEMGFLRQLLPGEYFDDAALQPLREGAPPRRIHDTYVKFWPVEYHAQSAVDAALELHRDIGDPARIASIHIDTFKAGYEIIAKDREKWDPQTRETADHSLPYIVVAALVDGRITRRSFSQERISDPRIRELLTRHTTLQENPELTAGYPAGIPNRITVHTHDGQAYMREVRYPRGHARNPMTDEEVIDKFRLNVEGYWTATQTGRISDFVSHMEEKTDLRELMKLMRR